MSRCPLYTKRAVSTTLQCTECGKFVDIFRKENKQRPLGHIKDMYCPYCQKDTKFVELKNGDCLYINKAR